MQSPRISTNLQGTFKLRANEVCEFYASAGLAHSRATSTGDSRHWSRRCNRGRFHAITKGTHRQGHRSDDPVEGENMRPVTWVCNNELKEATGRRRHKLRASDARASRRASSVAWGARERLARHPARCSSRQAQKHSGRGGPRHGSDPMEILTPTRATGTLGMLPIPGSQGAA
jgi:hypothetical protein